jgi:predicted PurR-regulated permease PerM
VAAASSSGPNQRPFYFLGSLVLVAAALYFAKTVLIPLAVAILLSFILTPVVAGLQRRGFKRVYAVLVVVLLVFLLLGGIGYVLTAQVTDLARQLPQHKANILHKLENLRGPGQGIVDGLVGMVRDIGAKLHETPEDKTDQEGGKAPDEPTGQKGDKAPDTQREPQRVVIVSEDPTGLAWLVRLAGPLLEPLATVGLIFILLVFMLLRREDLRNRMIRLVGHGRLTGTTKALEDAATRISRYLFMQLVINAGFGLMLGIGLALVGLPYAFLWGILAGALRFIPYLGTWVAALLPLTLSVAFFPDWLHPLLVLGVFLGLELLTFNVLEPLLFSHSTGVSPVALLVAAAFWAWLWGPIGLLLSTPLTTCLVVLGKYVPNLEFFDVLLGDEPVLDTKLTYYQRLLARDQDEATDLVEEYLKNHPLETVYDEVLLPALVLAKRNREEDEITTEEERFIFQVTRDILDDLVASQQQVHLIATGKTPAAGSQEPDRTNVLVFGCPAQDKTEEMALEMFRQMLAPTRCRMEVLSPRMLAGEVVARVKEAQPALVVITSVPPGGLAPTRYLCKRLRSQFPGLKVAVGRWGQGENLDKVTDRLRSAGADLVAGTLLESRNQVVPLIQVAAHLPAQPVAGR